MRCWAILCLILVCEAQPLPPETLVLAKVKAKVAESLSSLPNLTCTETIRRTLWFQSSATPEMVDTVRLEVAYVQKKELYGWPGGSRIDEPDIGKLVGGSVGSGYFALFLNNIFLGQFTNFHYVSHAKLEGLEALRYDYQVPQLAGAYRLSSARGAALVGYHGSVWVREESAELARIAVIADDVPTELGFSAASSQLDFGVTSIGGRSYLVPTAAEIVFVDTLGNRHISELSFQSWHAFVGESVIKFNPPAPGPTVALPAEFTVDVDLLSGIGSGTSAGGDPIEAVLRDDIKLNGATVVPKGAALSGRIARLTKNGASYLLEFHFTSISFEGGHADLSGRDNRVAVENWERTGQGPQFSLPRGTHLTLHSQAAEPRK